MNYNLKDINEQIKKDKKEFVSECEKNYQNQIIECVDEISSNKNGKHYKFVLLAGPSSAGKTTTSYLLKENLNHHGFNAKVISIDNFFLERSETPKLPNGNYDYESLKAIDWHLFGKKMKELIENKKTILPVFDFIDGVKCFPDEYTTLNDNEIIIIEGLHGINPIINNYIPTELAYKVYLNTESEFVNDNEVILSKESIKLIRRLIRDFKKRGATPERTFNIWSDVLNGEKTYITPFKDTADKQINSTHAFEPSVYYNYLVEINNTHKHEKLTEIIKKLEPFYSIPCELIPLSSLTQEFLGGNNN